MLLALVCHNNFSSPHMVKPLPVHGLVAVSPYPLASFSIVQVGALYFPDVQGSLQGYLQAAFEFFNSSFQRLLEAALKA